jgi:hypothetical protein
MKYDYIINVSDEFYWLTDKKLLEMGVEKTFWFPISENKSDIGLNSIYGALVILYNAQKNNKSVYLHCHSGINRSEIVRSACYFMLYGEHYESKETDLKYINRLIKACHEDLLLPKDKTEKFLTLLKKFLDNFDGEPMGGLIDEIKLLLDDEI